MDRFFHLPGVFEGSLDPGGFEAYLFTVITSKIFCCKHEINCMEYYGSIRFLTKPYFNYPQTTKMFVLCNVNIMLLFPT